MNSEPINRMCKITQNNHIDFSELNKYIGKTVSYGLAKALFSEKIGAFFRNKNDGTITYYPMLKKDMLLGTRKTKIIHEEDEEMVILFHTHPYGYPNFSTVDITAGSDLKGNIAEDAMFCLGAGDPDGEGKSIACINLTEYGKDNADDIEDDLISSHYDLLPYTRDTISPWKYAAFFVKKPFLSRKGNVSRIKTKIPLTFPLSDEDKKLEYEKRKQWLIESGYFNFTEHEC